MKTRNVPLHLLLMLCLIAMLAGCVTPAQDYILADEAAWDSYEKDGMLDKWIDGALSRGEITKDKADALRALNVGRRARISHAKANVAGGGK